jgi:cytochrome c-type biogenesis protein CcmH/NrfG
MIVLALASVLAGALLAPAQSAADEDPVAFARQLRELRRGGRAADGLALLGPAPPALLADVRVAGERLLLLLDEGRLGEARALDESLGTLEHGPVALLAARLRLSLLRGGAAEATEALRRAEAACAQLTAPLDLIAVRIAALAELQRWPEAAALLAELPGTCPAHFRDRLSVELKVAEGRALAQDPELLERAIPLLEAAHALQPAHVGARAELALALAQWQRVDRAEQLLREALAGTAAAVDPVRRADLLHALGKVQCVAQRDGDAAATFREVLALKPGHGRATLGLARCLLRAGEAGDAVAEAEGLALLHQQLERSPDDPEALFVLAERALERREAAPAIDALQRILQRHPHSLKALYLHSRALALAGDLQQQADVLRHYTERTAALAMR